MNTFISFDREATVVVRSEQVNCIFIAVKSECFFEYIIPLIGTVHDCYIATISNDWSEIDLHGVPFDVRSILGRKNNERDNLSDEDDADRMESDTPSVSNLNEPLVASLVPPLV